MLPQLSFAEIVVIVIVAVVFIRPDDWPRFLRLVGRLYGQMHAYLLRAQDYSRQTFTEITQLDEPPPTPMPPAAASPPALAAGPAAPAAGSAPPPAATPAVASATEPQEDASAK